MTTDVAIAPGSASGELPRLRSLAFTVHGTPIPKARARKGRGNHWHTPAATRKYETQIGWTARAALSALEGPRWPLDARYRVECAIYTPDARARDCSNILKSVEDAMNEIVFNDDSQVIETATLKRIDRDDPRIDVRIYVLETP